MFGKKKTAKAEAALMGAKMSELRLTALLFLQEELVDCGAFGDVAAILGAAELAERLGLLSHDEFLKIHKEAYDKHNAWVKAKKAAKE